MGKDSGGGSSGGGAPQVVQPEMPQSPLLSQGLLPGATGRMNASLPWLNSGGRTIDYLHQYSASPMQTPQFDMGGFQNLQNQQRQTAQAWQNGLGMMFPSPWGTQLGYAGGGMATQRFPTGNNPMGGGPQGPMGAAPPASSGGGAGGPQQGGPNYDPNPAPPQYWGVGGNPFAEFFTGNTPHLMPGTQQGPIQANPWGGSDPLMERQAQIEQQLRGQGGQSMFPMGGSPQTPGSVNVGQNAPLARGSVNGGMPGAVPQQPFVYSPGSGQAGY